MSGKSWRLISSWPCLRHKSKVSRGSRTRRYGEPIRLRSMTLPQSMEGNNMLLRLRCIMGPAIHLRSISTKVDWASIWPKPNPACGALQSSSPRTPRTAITMPSLPLGTGQSKSSVPKFWSVNLVSKGLTTVWRNLLWFRGLRFRTTASRVRLAGQMSSWCTPTRRPILSIWLPTSD